MSLHGYKRSTRRTLKAHLDGQWKRGYSGPHGERTAKKPPQGASKKELKKFLDSQEPEPVTLAEVWPDE